MLKQADHHYNAELTWTRDQGDRGGLKYRDYAREHKLAVNGKPTMTLSADPAFRGREDHLNPEDLLLASLSSCHFLCFMAHASHRGLDVRSYDDSSEGIMVENRTGGGAFTRVLLRPNVTFGSGTSVSVEQYEQLHSLAAKDCFIAASVNFPVEHASTFEIEGS